jgi:predicted lipoprotein
MRNDTSWKSWATLAILSAAAAARLGCVGAGTPSPATEALAAMLSDLGPQVVLPALDAADTTATALADAADAWAADPANADAQAAAQQAWRDAMLAWQACELLQLGPAGDALAVVGGAGLRDDIYSWPTVNRCRVDQETVGDAWRSESFVNDALVNVRGLDALETLLFSPAGENGCPADVSPNADGAWGALGDAVQARRAEYAAVLAHDVRDRVHTLHTAWDPAGGDFSGALAAAGGAESPYESPDAALVDVYASLYYLDLFTRDRKLAEPLGLRDCVGESCLDTVETPLAGGSDVWIRANLTAFRALFFGGDGAGLDDVITAAGHADVVAAMATALDDADAAAAALTVPVDDAVATNPEAALAVHDRLTPIVDLLRGDVATVLSLQVPSEAAGDND